MRVMVALYPGDPGVTYEAAEGIAVGDRVKVPYGNAPERIREGEIIALGSQPRRYPDGREEPAYTGPCKRIIEVLDEGGER